MHQSARPSLTLFLVLLVALLASAGPVAAQDPSPKPSPSGGGTGEQPRGPQLFGTRSSSPTPGVTPAVALPSGFRDRVVISGLREPTVVQFADDGRIFVGEKSGVIKTYASLTDTTPTVVADLSAKVHNFWDRGMLGLALHPDFPTPPHLYVLYTHNRDQFGNPPLPGMELGISDDCPDPPGFDDGCPATGILSRLVLEQVGSDWVMDRETGLIADWCQQNAWHSIGTVLFGPDGMLYAGSGEGSYAGTDYGHHGGTPGSGVEQNPCHDPPYPTDIDTDVQQAEGGALRSQDVRTRSDPTGLSGSIIRIDPATGLGVAGNPWYGDTEANVKRIVAYGLRNPYRFTFRPGAGTPDLWIGDVGEGAWEEIDRLPNAAGQAAAANFGWPCYEGTGRKSDFDSRDFRLCETLYAQGSGAVAAPYWAYLHAAPDSETNPVCGVQRGGSAITGMAFYAGTSYPTEYRDALFFADYSRNCITVMPAGTSGLPDPVLRRTFVTIPGPVQLITGPGGDLFYVEFAYGESAGGALHRIVYEPSEAPTAIIDADPLSGEPPLDVVFDGRGSSDPEGGALTYAWDLDGDTALDDGTAAQMGWRYGDAAMHPTTGDPAAYPVTLQVTDPVGETDTASTSIEVGTDPPMVSYVSDRTWTSFINGWGDPERDRSNGEAGASDGGPITLNGVVYRKGVGVHTTQGPDPLAEIRLPVTGCTRFLSDLGVDDEVGANGSVSFQVWADGTKLYDSTTALGGPLLADSPIATASVALPAGVSELRLVTTDGGDNKNFDHADWAGARLLCPGNARPRPTISTPTAGTTWSVGQRIDFSGSATDREDGDLDAADLGWALVLHHCSPVDPSSCHAHSVRQWDGVSGGFFTTPDHEYPSHLELILTATDSEDATRSTSRLLQPRTADLTMASSPTGITLTAGAVAAAAPFEMTAIVGSRIGVSAPRVTQLAGLKRGFVSWSDGGARDHVITATADRTYTARYVTDGRPDACADVTSDMATGVWLRDAIHEGDADWFRFRQPAAGRVRIVLGALPADYALELYGDCGGTRIARADRGGRSFEEMLRKLAAGTYHLRVVGDGATSTSRYALLVQRLPERPLVLSKTTWQSGSNVRVAGEVLNNTAQRRSGVAVRFRLLDASGAELARHDVPVHARILGAGGRSSFLADLPRPTGYDRYTIAVLSRTTSAMPTTGLTTSVGVPRPVPGDPDAVRYRGTVENRSTTSRSGVRVSITAYDAHGRVLIARRVSVSPSTLAEGASGVFDVVFRERASAANRVAGRADAAP